jgi:hypothetical protein
MPKGLVKLDFVAQAAKSAPSLRTQTVLIVELKPCSWWTNAGKNALMDQIDRQAGAAFEDQFNGRRLYWIAVIGYRAFLGIWYQEG